MRSPWLIVIFFIALVMTADAYQTSHRRADPRDRDPIPQDLQAQPKVAVDREKVRREAEELRSLAGTIPDDVHRASSGVLSKDLKDKLKRIEKLAKSLRGDLQL